MLMVHLVSPGQVEQVAPRRAAAERHAGALSVRHRRGARPAFRGRRPGAGSSGTGRLAVLAAFAVFAAFALSTVPSSTVPSSTGAELAGRFPLVAAGRAAAIVVDPAEGAAPELAQAIEDFRAVVEQATGIRPEVRRSDELTGRPVVRVGLAAGPLPGEAEVGYDGYAIDVGAAVADLAGPGPPGTANAIYDFLETAVGARFLGPGPAGSWVPRRAEILVPAGERRERPAFTLRQAWYNNLVLARATPAERAALELFSRRNRAGGVRAVIRHYFADLVPPGVYFSEHPEYFAEVRGQRVPDGQLCTTHPYVAHLAVEHWNERFVREPDLRIGSLSPNDGDRFCGCPNCRELGRDLTARLVHFFNDVTRRVAAEHPDRCLAFYAYGALVEPPYERGVRLNANLIPVVARYGVCQVHPIAEPACPSNSRFRRQLEGWVAIARQIMARDFAAWWPVPDLTLTPMSDNLRTYLKLGAIGISREYLHRGFMSDLLMAVDLHLMWNPGANPDSLVDDFLGARFGPAAPGLGAAVAELRAALAAVPPATVLGGDAASAAAVYRPEALRSVVERLDRLAAGAAAPMRGEIAAEADLARAALSYLEGVEATSRYKHTGRPADREAAARRLREGAKLARRLEAAGRIGANAADELDELLAELEAPGLAAPLSGRFAIEDDMGQGGFSRRDASRIDGFYAGTYGLYLSPGKVGRVAFTFEARPGERVARAELHDLVLHGSSTRIEVKVGGAVHPVADGTSHDDRELVHDLTPLVAGSERFTLVFWAQNATQKPILCLDHWGVRGEVK
jgi:hypothetical protein